MTRVRSAAVVGMIVMLVTGCSASGGGRIRGAPGTRLPAGFEVAPGSRLVGTVFTLPSFGRGPAWLALSDVGHDPLAVYDDYVAQARKLGIPLPGSGTSRPYEGAATCHLSVDNHWAPVGTFDPAPADALQCYGAGLLPDDEGSVVLQATWGGGGHHVLLEIARDPVMGGGRDDLGDKRAETPTVLPKVASTPLASEPGEPFGGSHNAFEAGYRRFTLEAGSRVLADVTGLTDGVLVVLQVDGDAGRVMAGYARQLGKGGTTPRVRREPTPDGDVLAVDNAPEGGGAASLVTDPTGRWLLIRASSD